MSVIIFIIILAFLIFAHELGHFVFAKWFGIRVDEFAIGFPPRIWSVKRGETAYSINAIPFGGYVKIFGENPDNQSMSGPDSARSFVNAQKWKQSSVLVAGIFFNILFAWILLSISFMFGLTTSIDESLAPYAKDARVIVTMSQADSPARLAGISGGETIVSLASAGQKIDAVSVDIVRNFIAKSDEEIIVDYKKDGKLKTVSIVPVDGLVDGRKAIGIAMDNAGTVKLPIHKAFISGMVLTKSTVVNVSVGLYYFIFDAIKGKASLSQMTGPVGIVSYVGEAAALGVVSTMSFAAFISINLAVINIVPFPALDGGRLLFVAIEAVRRKALNPKIANAINNVGFALLILMMLIVTYKDIVKMF